ncbi:MAG TPA: hypothetical protein VHN14_21655 [Kofleriaceae bacterium]|nr:hypothetical protein [Kofleriaceae bacterium]
MRSGAVIPEPEDGERVKGSAVKWLLGAGLLHKLLAIVKSFLVNELDLRDWMSQSVVGNFCDGRDDVWFDYIADTGDNEDVMRTLARNLRREFAAGSLGPGHPTLPAGAFLFVGGDTAYHVADETTLRRRFVTPINESLPDPALGPVEQREIFAIPGNHDYYDNLVGFNRLFRTPYPSTASSVLALSGYRSRQEASYIKILLPHGWQLWGADVGSHGLDYRQRLYFRSGDRPQRLILCTPTPPVSLGRMLVDRDPEDPARKAYLQLLDPNPEPNPVKPTAGFDPAFTPDSGGQLPAAGECRLHLAGDDHHYARYNGHAAPGDLTPTSVATIVSGGGGAFTHPTEHRCGSIAAAVTYPEREQSRSHIAATLVNPFAIIRAGMLHIAGIGLALLFYCHWPANWSSLVGPAIWMACLLIALLIAAGSLVLARHLTHTRIKLGKRKRGLSRIRSDSLAESLLQLSVLLPPIGIIVAIAVPIMAHPYFPAMDPLASSTVWLVSAVTLVVGLVLLASLRGAASLTGAVPKLGFAVLGLAHAAIVLLVPYLLIQQGWLAAGAVMAAMMIVFPLPARMMYRRAPAIFVTALWLIQGLGAIAALWWWPWAVVPSHGWSTVLLGALAGGIVVPMQFGFYILTCSAWNGHNNEAGISARLTCYKQWIRFHVTKDQLTGYVIGIDDPTADDVKPRLIDRFVIAPAPAASPGSPSCGAAGRAVQTRTT